ncbi:MAG: NadS family protein [Caenibius sp.]
MATFGEDLIESLNQAVDHAKGKITAAKVHVVQVPDVRSLRARLKMSQQGFSEAYGIPLATLKGWEQGRRQPDATAAAYLNIIEKMPKEAQAALHG